MSKPSKRSQAVHKTSTSGNCVHAHLAFLYLKLNITLLISVSRQDKSQLLCKQVETLDDISSRERSGARCWENILLCKPHGLWNRRPDWMKQAWHHFLKFGDFGQQVSSSALFTKSLYHYCYLFVVFVLAIADKDVSWAALGLC